MKTRYFIILIFAAAMLISCGGSTINSNKQWEELIKFSGKGDKKSTFITYEGGDAKLKYQFKANIDMGGVFGVYVLKKGVDPMKEGAMPEIMLADSENGESNLSHLTKGEYYIMVTSANGSWEVSVEELKTVKKP